MSGGGLPWIARAWIALVVPEALRDELAGDLRERHQEVRSEAGAWAARRWLLWQLATLNPVGLRRDRPGAGGGWSVDLKQAVRALRIRKGATLMVVGTVALAVGSTTSVYSVVSGVLLRPLPYPDADRLVRIWQTKESWRDSPNSQLRAFADRFPLSMPTFDDWTEADVGFASLGAFSGASVVLQGVDGAEVLPGERVTSGVFEVLGVPAVLGRTFSVGDDAEGSEPVIVLADGFWRERFGGDRGVIGSTMVLDGTAHTVVGVMPPGFTTPSGGRTYWLPMTDDQRRGERDWQWLEVVGRLQDGVSMEQAATRLASVQERLADTYPDEQGDVGSRVVDLQDSVVGNVRSTLWFLFGAVALVLVIATVNITNILTVTGMARTRELAVKAALGAGRARLVRGRFLESALLAGAGGLGGLALAWAGLPMLLRLLPPTLPRRDAIAMSPGVALFGIGLSALTALLVGTVPAILAGRAQPGDLMRAAGRGLTAGRGGARLRSGLVVAEVSLAFVLATGAGLLGHSFLKLWSVDRGFATRGLLTMSVVPDPAEYPEREDQARFALTLQERLEAIPGIRASASNQVPLGGSLSSTTYQIERPEGEPDEATVVISVGLLNYLDVMGIPVVEGRGFEPGDFGGGPPVALVSQTMARELWPGESPLGKRVRSGAEDPWVEVVGVVRDVRHQRLDEETDPKLYVPATRSGRATFQWVLRVSGDLTASTELARAAVREISPTTPVRRVSVLEERIAQSVAVPRFRTFFVVGLAAFAVVLALLGVYGALAFAVSQRTREIGLRMALGAHSRSVVWGVVGSGLRLAGLGVALGLLASWRLTGTVAEFLFELSPADPATFGVVTACVLAVSCLAAYAPARRAARVDPVRVLNSE